MKAHFPNLEISTSLPNNIEINSAKANKGLALKFLCGYLGIGLEECMAFGDETNDLALKLPVCRIVKRIQLSADHGDLQLSGASVYFKAARSASQSLNIPSEIKEGQTTDWININSDNDNKRCVSKITFSGHTVNSSDMATLKIIGDD